MKLNEYVILLYLSMVTSGSIFPPGACADQPQPRWATESLAGCDLYAKGEHDRALAKYKNALSLLRKEPKYDKELDYEFQLNQSHCLRHLNRFEEARRLLKTLQTITSFRSPMVLRYFRECAEAAETPVERIQFRLKGYNTARELFGENSKPFVYDTYQLAFAYKDSGCWKELFDLCQKMHSDEARRHQHEDCLNGLMTGFASEFPSICASKDVSDRELQMHIEQFHQITGKVDLSINLWRQYDKSRGAVSPDARQYARKRLTELGASKNAK